MARPIVYGSRAKYEAERQRLVRQGNKIARDRLQGNVARIYTSSISKALERAVNEGTWGRDMTRKLNNLMENMESGARDGRELAAANKRIAKHARTGALVAYRERVTGGSTYAGKYRAGHGRDSGGLIRALSSSNSTIGNAKGVFLWNKRELDKQAKHWYRLNYGAESTSGQAPRGGFSKAPDKMTIDLTGFTRRGYQHTSGQSSLRPRQNKLSEGFRVPELRRPAGTRQVGFTAPDRGQFYFARAGGPRLTVRWRVTGPEKLFPTRGIQGRFFLEAGTSAALASIGEEYGKLPKQWFLKAKRTLR